MCVFREWKSDKKTASLLEEAEPDLINFLIFQTRPSAGFGTDAFLPVAGLHRASPSATLDKR
jgi:hypothetical protein